MKWIGKLIKLLHECRTFLLCYVGSQENTGKHRGTQVLYLHVHIRIFRRIYLRITHCRSNRICCRLWFWTELFPSRYGFDNINCVRSPSFRIYSTGWSKFLTHSFTDSADERCHWKKTIIFKSMLFKWRVSISTLHYSVF